MTDQRDIPEIISSLKSIKRKPPRLVPLFSWKSILILGLGLIAGILVALGYWLVSPSLTSSGTGTDTNGSQSSGLLGKLGLEPKGPYQSQVMVQVVSPGSEYLPLATLQQRAEYYAAKAHSLPFFTYLSQQLSRQIPGFTDNVDKLGKIITTEYDIKNALPIIKVNVVAPTEGEATALAELIPQNFSSYLTAEEKDKRQKSYNATLAEIDTVKAALYKAQNEVNALKPAEIFGNPNFISLTAKVNALQKSLDDQASQLSILTVSSDETQAEYDNTLAQIQLVSNKIDEAKHQLQTLGQQNNNGIPVDDAPALILDAKIKALQAELDKTMIGYTVTSGTSQTRVAGLAEMISNGDTTSSEYQAALVKAETTSKALSDAKNQLARIQNLSSQNQTAATPDYQVLQIKIDTLNAQQTVLKDKLSKLYQQTLGLDTSNNPQYNQALFSKTSVALAEAKKGLADLEKQLGFDSISSDLNLKVAQDKVNNLSSRMEGLTEQLGSLVGNNADTLQTDYLVAGKPSSPFPILPPRGRAKNTLLGGAVIGIVLAWGLLNYKWIKKTWLSSGALNPEEGQESQ